MKHETILVNGQHVIFTFDYEPVYDYKGKKPIDGKEWPHLKTLKEVVIYYRENNRNKQQTRKIRLSAQDWNMITQKANESNTKEVVYRVYEAPPIF